MAPRKNAQSTAAELSLVHLKNCLVNLPPTLVSLLVNVNTVRHQPNLPPALTDNEKRSLPKMSSLSLPSDRAARNLVQPLRSVLYSWAGLACPVREEQRRL